jgi:hypothetical protein
MADPWRISVIKFILRPAFPFSRPRTWPTWPGAGRLTLKERSTQTALGRCAPSSLGNAAL